ncbi:MAG: hypothetical protein E6J45_13135 [Chloroflexi bacterium]|nr:MAG: hypothetical protein E6J45_13135 [Chloroflexota bacterium]
MPPPPQQMPTQEVGTRRRPSGPVDCQEEGGESEAEQEQESENGGEEQEVLAGQSLLQTLLPPL